MPHLAAFLMEGVILHGQRHRGEVALRFANLIDNPPAAPNNRG